MPDGEPADGRTHVEGVVVKVVVKLEVRHSGEWQVIEGSLEEILAGEWTDFWKNDLEGPVRWSQSGSRLMAEYDSGFKWWVVGFFDAPPEGLPEWKPRYRAEIDGKACVLEGEEVFSSCAGMLTLKDGRVVKDLSR